MKKKIRQAVGAVFLALAIAVTQIPAANASAASDFQMNGKTLVKYTGTASVVSVPAGTERIEAEAFADCVTLKELSLPGSLEEIGKGAFRGCSLLTKVVIPANCEVIEAQAFADCTALSEFKVGASVEEIGSGVWAGDKKLPYVSVDIANDEFFCKDGVLYGEDATKVVQMFAGRVGGSYTMPSSITDIEKYAFWGCKNLVEINLSSNLSEIPAYAFSYCNQLEKIVIPYSVSQIHAKAFEHCPKLTDVTIPASVRSIHATAFDGCYDLNIISEAGSVAEEYFANYDASQAAQIDYELNESEIGEVDLTKTDTDDETDYPEGVTSDNASDLSDATVKEIPDSKDVIGRTKIVADQAIVFVDNSQMVVIEGDEEASASGNTVSVNDETVQKTDNIVSVKDTVVNGDTIADKAYYKRADITRCDFPDGIKKIGDFAFARSGLTEIEIPQGVNHIGYGAFYHCDQLNDIIIPSSVTSIEPSAFEHTSWLKQWYECGDVDAFLVVGDGILVGYKGNSEVVKIPSNVKKIGAGVFASHNEIKSLHIPESVVEIGEDAFKNCVSLSAVSGGGNVLKICDRAFMNCPLDTVRITGGTRLIGLKAFANDNAVISGDCTSAVLFQGLLLPKLSFEKSAMSLFNDSYREPAISGVNVAVVDGAIESFEDTILDEDVLGYRGLVVSIITEPTETQYGAVQLKYCTLEPDASTGIVKVDDSVFIYGQEYKITGVDTEVFSAYKHISDWSAYHLTGIEIDSAITLGRDLTEGIDFAESAGKRVTTVSENAAYVNVTRTEDSAVKEDDVFKAEFGNRDEFYKLCISKDETSEVLLADKVAEKYGAFEKDALYTMNLQLFDRFGQVPINSLGSEPMTVTMSIPPGMEDDTLCVVCLDSNNQLEVGNITYVPVDDETCIQFEVNHFSPYGIYCATGDLADKINTKLANTTAGALRDDSPDTGDYFDPRWVLGIGFLSMALLLLLWRGGRKEIK